MREILFRGKRVDNGEWVEGDLLIYADTVQIWVNGKRGKENYIVIPETVGQYTGLTDKNGNKIFEGDIVNYDVESIHYRGIYEVTFEQRGSSAFFGIKRNNIETWSFRLEVPSKIMEGVCNIYDNPELLEMES